jgi:putative ABC transport system substrate-binding protein
MIVRRFPLRGWQDVDTARAALVREPVDGLLVLVDRVTAAHRANFIQSADQLRLPAVSGPRYFVDDGGLMSYGIDWPIPLLGTADPLVRILDGAKPSDLPVQRPTRFYLVLNQQTSKALGLALPRSLLLQATEVVE